jgi:putative ABC transport system substrate-binding protein
MRRKVTSLALCALTFALCFSAEAQQPTKKIPRVGFLIASSASSQAPRLEAFKQGMRALGYVEGQNILIEIRSGEGKGEQLPRAAAELVDLKVEVIVSGGPTSTRAASEATSTIPIVTTFESDPLGDGMVASLARPGGNITGLTTLGPELSGKRLELLKEIVPRLSRVAVFHTEASRGAPLSKQLDVAASALGIRLQKVELRGSKDIEPAFQAATNGRAGAILAQAVAVLLSERRRVAELAIKSRLAAMFSREEFINVG